jgi:hypothetical protein
MKKEKGVEYFEHQCGDLDWVNKMLKKLEKERKNIGMN